MHPALQSRLILPVWKASLSVKGIVPIVPTRSDNRVDVFSGVEDRTRDTMEPTVELMRKAGRIQLANGRRYGSRL